MNRVLVLLVALFVSSPALAQTYPSRPIRLVVPWPAGGTVDGVARVIGPSFSSGLGRPLLVENRAGAGGSIGQAEVAKAPADGHTLLLVFDTHAVNHLLYKNLGYDPFKSFEHVSLIVTSPQVLVGATNFAPSTVAELVTHAKSNPGRVTYATVGAGSSNHLNALLFANRTGIEMTHVPYKGGAPMMIDLVGGQVNVMFVSAPQAIPQVKAGRIKALAIGSAAPHPPASRYAYGRRVASGILRAILGRNARAGGNAEGHRRAAARRTRRSARRSGSARQARRPGLRRRGQHARGVPRVRARGIRQMGEGDSRLPGAGGVDCSTGSNSIDALSQGEEIAMPRDMNWVPQGVIPAVLLPFNEDLSIDEASFRAHLRDVASVEGLSAITINAHSTEVASCTFDEQKRVLAIARDEIGGRLPIVHGVYAEGSLEAARIAKHGGRRRRGGAAGLPARALHHGPAPRDGDRALPAHRGSRGSSDHCFPVPARRRPGLSSRDAPEDHRGGAAGRAQSRTGARARSCTSARSARCSRSTRRSTCSPRTAPG